MMNTLLTALTLSVGQPSPVPLTAPPAPARIALPPTTPAAQPASDPPRSANGQEAKDSGNSKGAEEDPQASCVRRFLKAYKDEFCPPPKKEDNGAEEPEKPRRALPAPF